MVFAEFPWQIFMSPFGIPIVAVICIFSWLAIASVSEAVAKVMCNRNDTEMKLELLARGMTAEEITRVVEAGRGEDPAKKGHRHAPATTRHAAPL